MFVIPGQHTPLEPQFASNTLGRNTSPATVDTLIANYCEPNQKWYDCDVPKFFTADWAPIFKAAYDWRPSDAGSNDFDALVQIVEDRIPEHLWENWSHLLPSDEQRGPSSSFPSDPAFGSAKKEEPEVKAEQQEQLTPLPQPPGQPSPISPPPPPPLAERTATDPPAEAAQPLEAWVPPPAKAAESNPVDDSEPLEPDWADYAEVGQEICTRILKSNPNV